MIEYTVAMSADGLDGVLGDDRWCVTADSPRAAALAVSQRDDWAAYGGGRREGKSDTRLLALYVRGGGETWVVMVAAAPERWVYGVRSTRQEVA